MNEQRTQQGKPDIWDESVKNHCAKAKLSLLCYIDEIIPQSRSTDEKDRLGRIKARIHNEISQLSLDIRILFRCQRAGADITPLGDEMIRKSGDNYKARQVKRAFNNLPNPVLPAKKEEAK
ncbi:unnamed protein product [marine sediment metagenome]|uniref:Uncharacterized protein n=1 Tax=marine sediment metagenome TaxID=412755 RepID=X0WIY5_9ZZZZ